MRNYVGTTNRLCTNLCLRQEDRYAQIERDNRLLLEKMSHIMRKGGVDNHNSTSKYAKSLNKGARKKELHKITTENQVGVFLATIAAEPAAKPSPYIISTTNNPSTPPFYSVPKPR